MATEKPEVETKEPLISKPTRTFTIAYAGGSGFALFISLYFNESAVMSAAMACILILLGMMIYEVKL